MKCSFKTLHLKKKQLTVFRNIFIMLSRKIVFFGVAIFFGIANGESQVTNGLTPQEWTAIFDLRELLKHELPEAYMREEYWLLNWLKANELNVEKTEQAIKQYLQLRDDENLGHILKEDWSEMRSLFPYLLNATDKTGKPVLYIDEGQWDIAAYLKTENDLDHLIRYIAMMLEDSEAHVRQLRRNGSSIGQYTMLVNLAGFQQSKHLCSKCSHFRQKMTDLLAPSTAANSEKRFLVNVPYLFKMVYFLLSEDTRKIIHLYGQDQDQLEILLLGYIDQDQIPKGILNITEKDNSEGAMNWDEEQ